MFRRKLKARATFRMTGLSTPRHQQGAETMSSSETARATGKRGKQAGFSLVEMAMVLIIVATLTAIGISAGSSTLEAMRVTQTNQKLSQIKRALHIFRVSNGRIPCPASLTLGVNSVNFGVQGPKNAGCFDAAGGAATATRLSSNGLVAEGGVPTKSLMLPDDFAFDGWGNRIRYAVNTTYTETSAFASNPINDTCPGAEVLDGTGASNFRTQSGVYALLSHGPNGHGAHTRSGAVKSSGSTNANEQTNCGCNSSATTTTFGGRYVQAGISNNPASATDSFDDIVEYQERWQMALENESTASAASRPPEIGLISWSTVVRILKYSGGTFTLLPGANISPPMSASNVALLWTPDRRYALAISSGTIDVYRRNGDTLTRASTLTTSLTGLNSGNPIISRDGRYLAVSNSGGGLMVFGICGARVAQLTPTHIWNGYPYSWSPNDDYLLSTAYVWTGIVRNNKDGSFTTAIPDATVFPTGRPSNNQRVSFSPSGEYALAYNNTSEFQTYYRSGATFLPTTAPTLAVPNAVSPTWSPDENYVAVSHPWNPPPVGSAHLRIIKRTGSGSTVAFTLLPLGAVPQSYCGGGPWSMGWTDDSSYLVTMGYGYTCSGLNVIRNNKDDTFAWLGPVAPSGGDPAVYHVGGTFSNGFNYASP
jgi:prepilin-type N-terminal cleavage/methylation domain-containing protein